MQDVEYARKAAQEAQTLVNGLQLNGKGDPALFQAMQMLSNAIISLGLAVQAIDKKLDELAEAKDARQKSIPDIVYMLINEAMSVCGGPVADEDHTSPNRPGHRST